MKKGMNAFVMALLTATLLICAVGCSSGASRSDGSTASGVSESANAGAAADNNAPVTTEKPGIDVGMGWGGWNNSGMPYSDGMGTHNEDYLAIDENRATSVADESLLTLSLKVDTASYNNIERYIQSGSAPPADAVKVEEMINYFKYDTDMTFDDSPFSVYTEVGPSIFSDNKYMAMIRVKTKDIDKSQLPPSNLTFLIDTSGSMDSYDKLPLLKSAFSLLIDTLGEDDKVSIVTYAGDSRVALDSVSGADKEAIRNAFDNIEAHGSTAGADGILTAYKLAEKNFRQNGNNRIILATDGDFNVGLSSLDELEQLISKKRESGVYLSVLGFGAGNLKDSTMETLAKHGNGNYSYISSAAAAKKVLVEELASNLYAAANDVKAQVEFNPSNVKKYRLIGYENRRLANADFADDTKDAGEIGVGTDVVVMFELELNDGDSRQDKKYGDSIGDRAADADKFADELFELRIRYKIPGEQDSRLILNPVKLDGITRKGQTSSDFNFASSVAAFGHILRDSEHIGNATLEGVTKTAQSNIGNDRQGYRNDFIKLLMQYGRSYDM